MSRSVPPGTETDDVMLGVFPYECSVCNVVCDTIEELSDPDHHN